MVKISFNFSSKYSSKPSTESKVLFISFIPDLFSQTFLGTGGNVPDYPNTATFNLNVSGLFPSILDTANFGLESICLNMNHTWDSDLEISLIAPDGTTIVLTSGNGGSGDNYLMAKVES